MAKQVLIVEDEGSLSHTLSLKLRASGLATTVVHDGQAALDAIAKNNYDLVLLDIIMPVLDGFQVLEQLKAKSSRPKIIVLSNLAQPNDERRVLELGALKYIVKSNMPLTQIVDEVRQMVDDSQPKPGGGSI